MDQKLPPPVLVDSRESLDFFARDVAACPEIAVDTEADSYFSYREKVCLIQVSTPGNDYIIDPLSNLDLGVLAPVLAAKHVKKIFHDAEYDVQLLKSAGFTAIAGIFDTRIAVSLLGIKTPGLANVLRDRYGIELDKSQQKSDWSRRPLTDEQLRYARHDTRYLIKLASDIEPEVRDRNIWDLFEFECHRVAATQPRERVFDPRDSLSMKGADALNPYGLSGLRELCISRDAIARDAGIAPFRVVGNDLLVLLAGLHPRDGRELDQVRAFPSKLRDRHGVWILDALARARAAGPWYPERPAPRFTDDEIVLLDRLKKWRTRRSEEYNMDSSGILNRHALEAIARVRPRTAAELAAIEGIAPWQLQRFQNDILQIVNI